MHKLTLSSVLCSFLALCSYTIVPAKADIWAVLVDGLWPWYNGYALESTTYETYQLLRRGGVQEDHIIVMSPEYVPYSRGNPLPGVVVYDSAEVDDPNQNGNQDENVYEDVKIDYSGDDVTKDSFMAVLNGTASAVEGVGTGRVVDSTSEDVLLVSLISVRDYGEYIAIGNDDISAKELISTLETANQNNRFKKMLFVAEMSDAGRIFDSYIRNDQNILVVASSSREDNLYGSSYNREVSTFTATTFNALWLDYVKDAQDGIPVTVFDAFLESSDAHRRYTVPNLYGQLEIGNSDLTEFYGVAYEDDESGVSQSQKKSSKKGKDNHKSVSKSLKHKLRKVRLPNDVSIIDSKTNNLGKPVEAEDVIAVKLEGRRKSDYMKFAASALGTH